MNKPYVLKNSDFQTIQIAVLFPYRVILDEIAKTSLLPALLVYMNKKYDSEEKFLKGKLKNFILSLDCSIITTALTNFISFVMVVPDKKSIGKDLLDDQFSFFEQVIYNPKVNNNSFDKFQFDREKQNLEKYLKSSETNIDAYYFSNLVKYVDDGDGYFSNTIINRQELVKDLNANNLYDFYTEKVLNNTPIIFVNGNISKKEANYLCNKYLYKGSNPTISLKYSKYLPSSRKTIFINEKGNFNDSVLSLVYKVKDVCENDFLCFSLTKQLLVSSSSRILENKLRGELNLIYFSDVSYYPSFGVLGITVYINKNNKELVYNKILEVIESLTDTKFIDPILNKIKERKRINLIRKPDNKATIFYDFIYKNLGIEESSEEKFEKISNITAEDIKKFIERLSLDTVYFLEEKEND